MKDSELYKGRNAKLREEYIYAFGRSSQVSTQHITDVYSENDNKTIKPHQEQ